MITSEAAPDFTKQERSSTSDHNNSKSSSSSITSWSRLKDPRIVRVSRAFGGKDRHSKVCTVRGLRDRRVRLSVPTAIQLYDLQDRLGLNQPSKVVDWLLNAAKNEIDELPPLQFPQGTTFTATTTLLPMPNTTSLNISTQPHRSKGVVDSDRPREIEGDHWGRITSDHHQQHHDGMRHFNLGAVNQKQQHSSYISTNQKNPTTSLTSLINNATTPNIAPFNSFMRWDPSSNLTLSHHPRSPNSSSSPPTHQGEDWHNFSLSQHHHHHHQVLVCQPNATVQPASYFQSQIAASNAEYESSRPVHFNTSTANLLPSQTSDGS